MDENVTPANFEIDAVLGTDIRLLVHMSSSIKTAHAANPRCWVLSRTRSGTICLHIHATLVLAIRGAAGDFYALGNSSDLESDEFRAIARQSGDRLCMESLTVDQFDRAYTLLRKDHNALIADRAAVVKTRAMRADHHAQALVEELARALGIDMPEPEYLREDQAREAGRKDGAEQAHRLPPNYESLSDEVKAIYDALTDEAKAAVNALPDDLFIDAEGSDCSEILLDSILRAHDQAPESWSLVSFGRAFSGFIALNIQNKNIATIWRQTLTVVGQRESIDAWPEETDLVNEIASFNSNPESSTVTVPISSAVPSSVREQFIEAHHVLIDRLARGRSGIQAKNHRDDLRVKLALVTNVSVPAPGYVPTGTFGLPFGLRIVERNSKIEQAAADHTAPTTSGQAIYDALSDEAKAAVDALPNDLFTDAEGVDHAEMFLETVRIAHEGSAACWALLSAAPHGKWLVLNVASTHVTGLNQKLRLVIHPDLVDEKALGGRLSSLVSEDHFNSGVVLVAVDSSTPTDALPELKRANLLTVSRMAKGRVGRQGRDHRDDVRVKLALLTGEHVPAPAYVPESTYGMPGGLRIADGGGATVRAQDHVIQPAGESAIQIDVPLVLPQRFASAGLTYTGTQIASFYTALQTKGFVILSGISGTGKSKVALRFAELMPHIPGQPEALLAADWIQVAVKPYMKKHKRIRLLNEVSGGLPVPAPGVSILVPFSFNSKQGKCKVWTRPEAGAGTFLFPQGDVGEEVRKSIIDSFALRFRTRDDDSGIDYIEMVTELPVEQIHANEVAASSNHLFLPVRPDWRDGKALIGYHNPLTGEYVRTPFLEFAIAAADDFRVGNRNASFVILDEMNLAHVEYYFADVLSVIESGRDSDGWTVEGIPLAVGEEDADLPERLHLAPNLYIVGTVNMDETTHPFSPKVLDRAFTIELTDVSFSDYPPEPGGDGLALTDSDRQALLAAFTGGGERYPRIDKDEIRETVADHPQFRIDLESLNTSLKRYRMHFGYRVFDEIVQFVHNAGRNRMFASSDDAFDHAVLMKVLPKFNGSRARLERPLIELILWSRQSVPATEDDARAVRSDFENYLLVGKGFDTLVRDSDDWRYPATGTRAALMMQDLYTDGFAAFG